MRVEMPGRFCKYHIKYLCGGFCMLFFLFWISVCSVQAAPRIQQPANGDHFVIVIDPGHGGENEGTIENGFLEKTMTMTTAFAMYEELSRYDNVEVYLTRTTDIDLSLKERAEYAAGLNADFLFSIHYNASVEHDLFGSEVWISAFAPYNAYGYQFGVLQLESMRDMGLYLRGVKTKLNDRGTDYYGIIRESTALQMPAAIIEHCHVDEERDYPYCDEEEELIAFGRTDATNVAKYLGLSSTELGVDYSGDAVDLAEASASSRVQSTLKDETPPDVCEISLLDVNEEEGILKVQLTAVDYDSPMLYYQYSFDDGQSFSPLQEWPQTDALTGRYTDTFSFTMQVPSDVLPYVLVRVYNLFDQYTDSNPIAIPYAFHYGIEEEMTELPVPEEQEDSHSLGTTTFMPDQKQQTKEEDVRILAFIMICLMIATILLITVMISQILYDRRRRKKRQKMQKQHERQKQHEQRK